MDAAIRQRYQIARQALPAGEPITLLHVDGQQTVVAVGRGAEPDHVLVLEIGSARTAADFFLHTPPLPAELENAIQQVEDEVTRARQMVRGYPLLVSVDAGISEIAHIAVDTARGPIPIDAIEQVFSLLASYALGRPATTAGIPTTREFAATLLILREFMHHLGFASLTVKN